MPAESAAPPSPGPPAPAPTADPEPRARRALACNLDGFASGFVRLHPQPPSTEAQTRSMVQAVLAFLDPSALVAAHAPYGQGNWFAEVENSVVLHLLASAAIGAIGAGLWAMDFQNPEDYRREARAR